MNNLFNFLGGLKNLILNNTTENFEDISLNRHELESDIMYVGYFKKQSSMMNSLKNINFEFEKLINNDDNKITKHIWKKDFNDYINNQILELEDEENWKEYLCHGRETCSIRYVPSMTELYKAKVPFKRDKNLYGASGNFDVHVDMDFRFPNVRLYRILIGLTDNNKHVHTSFPEHDVDHKINFGDVVIFDFNKTVHKVFKDKDIDESRNMIKLHFVVCNGCTSNIGSKYLDLCMDSYHTYEVVTRHFMAKGADPENLYEFALGVTSYWMTNKRPYFCYIFILWILSYYNDFFRKNFYLSLIIYVIFVKIYWLRYNITGNK